MDRRQSSYLEVAHCTCYRMRRLGLVVCGVAGHSRILARRDGEGGFELLGFTSVSGYMTGAASGDADPSSLRASRSVCATTETSKCSDKHPPL